MTTGFKYDCRFARAWVSALLVPPGVLLATVLIIAAFFWECWKSGVPYAAGSAREDFRELAAAVQARLRWVLK